MPRGLPHIALLLLLLLITAAGVIGVFWLVAARGTSPLAPMPSVSVTIASPSIVSGTASCSAAACHGNVKPGSVSQRIRGNEYRAWLERDPHAQAYLALLDEPARQMGARLGIREPHTANQCLACHAASALATSTNATGLVILEPIGCEICHGSANNWLTLHYERTWQEMTATEKEALGMTNTKDLVVRSRLCAGCHVGATDRDVNHDLIAAGHPRLNFEFTSYLAMLPKHWDEKAKDPVKPTYDPAFEARAWAVGQAVSAAAALDVLAVRAAAGQGDARLEFAEFDCSACHHNLESPSWRQTETQRDQFPTPLKPGLPSWGTWYFAIPRLLDDDQSPLPRFNSISIDNIARSLAGSDLVEANLSGQIEQLQRSLNQWAEALNKATFDIAALRRFLGAIADNEEQPGITNWDSGVQLYSALIALYQAKLDGKQTKGQTLSPSERQAVAKFEAILNGLHDYHAFHPRAYRDNLHGLRSHLTE